MEKEIVWSNTAKTDFLNIVSYVHDNWTMTVFDEFILILNRKILLLSKYPHIGFKSKKYSRFRKSLVTKNYSIIYSVKKDYIVILRLKHNAMK
jgi:addiction module RelE/StbE family toxin